MTEAFSSSSSFDYHRVGNYPNEMARLTEDRTPIVTDEYTDPPASDDDAFLLQKNTLTSTAITYTALDGVVGVAAMPTPRNVIITTGGADSNFSNPKTIVVTGRDVNGDVISENFAITDAGSPGVFTGAKAFLQVTSIAVPALGTHTDGTIKVGFGALLGLRHKIASRAGRLAVLQEVAVGSVVTTGTFADSTTGAPNGTYSPASAADGTRDYAVTYERVRDER